MADVDAALEWAQANPEHPKAKAVMAKAWAMKNPNDPRSSQILSKLSGSAPIQPDAADKAASPNAPFLDHIHSVAEKLQPAGYGVPKAIDQMQTPQGTQELATNLVPGSASALSKGSGVLGRIVTQGLAGGATALGVTDPEQSNQSKLSTFLKGGVAGSALQTGGEAVGKVGDYLMQRSMGMRKYMPGVGTSLADQGLVGTRDMMTNQASSKLSSEEQNLQELVGQLKGNVDPKDIADAVAQHGKKFVSPSGITLNSVQPDLDKVNSAASQFSDRLEGLTPQDLLSLKRQGDWAGYTASGNPAAATDAEIGRAIADKSRSLLSESSGGETAESLGRERALILAKKALEKPEAIHQGAGAVAMFGKIPGTSLLESVLGQGAVKSSQAVSDPRTQRAVEQGLFEQGK